VYKTFWFLFIVMLILIRGPIALVEYQQTPGTCKVVDIEYKAEYQSYAKETVHKEDFTVPEGARNISKSMVSTGDGNYATLYAFDVDSIIPTGAHTVTGHGKFDSHPSSEVTMSENAWGDKPDIEYRFIVKSDRTGKTYQFETKNKKYSDYDIGDTIKITYEDTQRFRNFYRM